MKNVIKSLSMSSTLCLIVLLGIYSCGDNEKEKVMRIQQGINEMPIVTKAGCEYLAMPVWDNVGNIHYIYSHLGNCANPKHYFKDNNVYKYIVNLPDDYILISSNREKPDSLIGYISRDTLYILFNKTYKHEKFIK